MDREFTRRELYNMVWALPMTTIATSLGVSSVALAKHCKKADIPIPERGYWARKQAGKPTIQIAISPRFFGASDRIGGPPSHGYYGSDWVNHYLEVSIPVEPIFDEDLSSMKSRRQVSLPKTFQPAHPLVQKLLEQDEERRIEFLKWGSNYYAPKFDRGVERRRLLIINSLFLAAARLGCRPSMVKISGRTLGAKTGPYDRPDICLIYNRTNQIKIRTVAAGIRFRHRTVLAGPKRKSS